MAHAARRECLLRTLSLHQKQARYLPSGLLETAASHYVEEAQADMEYHQVMHACTRMAIGCSGVARRARLFELGARRRARRAHWAIAQLLHVGP